MNPATDPQSTPPPVSFKVRTDVPREGAAIGQHVRCTVFAGPDADHRAHTGVLVLLPHEAQALQERLQPAGDRQRLVLDAMEAHRPKGTNTDRDGMHRRHCAGCSWAGSPWESRDAARLEHQQHVADEILRALDGQ